MSDINFKSGYSEVNGMKMYYEIYGEGKPLAMIHGGGSDIHVTFERIIPHLSKNRQIIAMDMQAHGRTNDRDSPITFQQDADDAAELLKNLGIRKVDFLGFSNGGQTLIEIALRHADIVNKLIICSAFYKRSAVVAQFWEGFGKATIDRMPQRLKDEFLKVNDDPAALLNMFNRDVQRMKNFKDWKDEQIKSIDAPTFIMNGTHDVGSVEHAVEMYRLIPNCELAILPTGHGEYIGEKDPETANSKLHETTAALIERFLEKK